MGKVDGAALRRRLGYLDAARPSPGDACAAGLAAAEAVRRGCAMGEIDGAALCRRLGYLDAAPSFSG
jgi:hypothetical protein